MLTVRPGGEKSILELLREDGVLLESPCNGKGLCGKCKVRILRGRVSDLTPQEEKFLTPAEREQGIRLACLTFPLEETQLDPLGLLGERQGDILGGGELPEFRLAPPVRGEMIHLPQPTLEDGCALCQLLPGALTGGDTPPLSLLRRLPDFLGRDGQLVQYEGRAIDLRADQALYGLAVDIGTTTVAMTLVDLHTGRRLGEDGFVNPQKAFGLDVLSRIHYDMEHPGGVLELQSAIVQRLQKGAQRLAEEQGSSPDAIYEMVVGANSTMLHALLGVPLASLGSAPYSSVFNRPMTVLAGELGLRLNQQARVYCIPAVSAYIGGDIVSGALAARLDEAEDTVLFIDIGTNGEMILSRRGRMYSCSCAAGPALEGMNISCGMRAEPGAIERVSLAEGRAALGVIGGEAPRGLCGSGILEVVSQGVTHGVITKSGRISEASPLAAVDGEGKRRIVLDQERGIYVTQSDVRQVQLCKGAILSGILTLLERLELTPEEIDRVVVAGQFGKHLEPASLTGAGLLPASLEDRISYIGNSSMTGAQMCLLSDGERARAEEIARQVSYVELSVSPGYERLFTKSLQFGGV